MSQQYKLNGDPHCKKRSGCGSVVMHGKGKIVEELTEGLRDLKEKYPCMKITINGEKIEAKKPDFAKEGEE